MSPSAMTRTVAEPAWGGARGGACVGGGSTIGFPEASPGFGVALMAAAGSAVVAVIRGTEAVAGGVAGIALRVGVGLRSAKWPSRDAIIDGPSGAGEAF